ncbi:WD40 repeat domain-containing serine/threonine protein kinase [Nonomuraea sp. NPDC005650]|uniref:WD40 repeat domain-containing serine/threonine protein kinase n=1 Tax=Nonomuraea sp. NPDC005650 TaxID=3157045 RepID=UPI0033AD199A
MLNSADPQRIGEYWLAGRLGSGGQGVVYEAYDADGQRVALKALHAAGDEGSRDRFAKEAAAARRVASFCTARVLAADLEGSRPFIVSEYVPGPSLRQAVVAGRRFAGDNLHRLATAVATAITAIHEAGVIHRDLKPDNVLLGTDGPRVIDFGIARTLDMSLTKTGEVSGTPSYVAPEVFLGQRAGTPADVFAWGATMMFAATGTDPFNAGTLGGVMHRVLSHHPDLGELPPRLAELVSAALRKDPADRPAARDLLLALVSGDGSDVKGLLAAGSRTARAVAGPDRADPALGTIAEDAYGALEPEQRELAAEVFLRLVELEEDGQEVLRSIPYSELVDGRPEREAEAVRRVLRAFAYLVTSDGDTVELVRPALLRVWPRLRMWLDDDRDGLAVVGQISKAARHWADNGRRDGDLLQGSRLDQALSWAATGRRRMTLTPCERDFLQAGGELARKRARRRRLTTLALAGLLVAAFAAGGVAMWQGARVTRQRDVATAKQVAAVADSMRATDPVMAMLLSVAAWRVSPEIEARSSLMDSLKQQETAVFHDPPTQGVAHRVLSRDGRTLVSVSEGGVNVYDVRTGKRTGGWPKLGVKGEIYYDPVLSRSGRLLAQATFEELGVWDLTTGRRILTRKLEPAGGGGMYALFGEHETTLLVGYFEGLEYLLDLSTGKRLGKDVEVDEGGSALMENLLVDPTGRHLLVRAETLQGRSLPGWKRERRYPACRTRTDAAAFSPDGKVLACVGDDIALVDAATGSVRVKDESWSCDLCSRWNAQLRLGERHLVAFAGRDLEVWRIADHQEILDYRAEGDLADVRLDPDGRTLRYLMDDSVVGVDLAPYVASTRAGDAVKIKISQNGRWAAITADEAARLRLMDLRAHRDVATFPILADQSSAVGFDRSGDRMVIAQIEGKVSLIDLRTRKQVWAVRAPAINVPQEAQFSADGKTVVLSLTAPGNGRDDPRVVVYDAATGAKLHDFHSIYSGGPLMQDGRTMVSASGRFLDVTRGAPVGKGFDASTGLAVSSKGVIAVSLDGTGRVALWNADGPTPIRPVLPRAGGAVTILEFSPDGSTLAGMGDGGTIQLWDPGARRRIGGAFDLNAVDGPDSVEFSADGRTVYAAAGGRIYELPVDPERVVAAVCRRAGTTLSESDWARYLPDVPYRRVC